MIIGGVEVTETKVDDFDISSLGDEDVFDLEIWKDNEKECQTELDISNPGFRKLFYLDVRSNCGDNS